MPSSSAVRFTLAAKERQGLQGWTARRKTGQALALRARIVLSAAGQLTNRAIAELEGVSAPTVTKWRDQFAERRLEGLIDEPRPGRLRTIDDEQVKRVVANTLEGPPKARRMVDPSDGAGGADRAGLGDADLARSWAATPPPRELQAVQGSDRPSKDPRLVKTVHDICGLYLNPPERALVLCVDEKSQVQALDRTVPTLRILPGIPEPAPPTTIGATGPAACMPR